MGYPAPQQPQPPMAFAPPPPGIAMPPHGQQHMMPPGGGYAAPPPQQPQGMAWAPQQQHGRPQHNARGGKGAADKTRERDSLYVAHLPPAVSEADLRALFAPYGNIVHCRLIIDFKTGVSKGYGFVRYEPPQPASQMAIAALNGWSTGTGSLVVRFKNQQRAK